MSRIFLSDEPRFLTSFFAVLAAGALLPSLGGARQSSGSPSAPAPQQAEHGHRAAAATPLRELVEEAERNNPQIAAAYHGWQAAAAVPQQASALPDTQLTVQQFSVGSPRPFAGYTNSNFAYIGFGAAQDFPFPGKRALRRKVAELETNSVREQYQAARRGVIQELKLVYFQLAYIQQTLGVLERSDQVLGQVQQVVEARYKVGQGNQQDVLKAQLQHTKILQEIAHHHQREGQLETQLKQILNRPQTSPEILAEQLAESPITHTDTELLEAAGRENPDVRSRAEMVRRGEAQVELARKDFRPDFSFQYMWQRTDPTQFRAYYMAGFGLNLPNRKRRRAELAEAVQKQEGASKELESEAQRVLSEIKQQYVLVRTSEERLKIYKEGLIPQADATYRAGLAAYQANRQDFETLLSSFLDVLNLDLGYRRELVEHESALARLERLTGVTLP